jgi:hypothetical protein
LERLFGSGEGVVDGYAHGRVGSWELGVGSGERGEINIVPFVQLIIGFLEIGFLNKG